MQLETDPELYFAASANSRITACVPVDAQVIHFECP
jgi:hypothetical protein